MIKITADSTCDLSTEILKEMDITITPLVVMIGEKVHGRVAPADVKNILSEYKEGCVK